MWSFSVEPWTANLNISNLLSYSLSNRRLLNPINPFPFCYSFFCPVIFLSIRHWSFSCPSLFSSPPSLPPSPSVMSKASSRTLWWWAPTSGYGTCSRPRLATASAESPSQTTAKWAAGWWASFLLETSTSWRRRTTTCHWVRWVDLWHKTEATKSTVILMLYSCFIYVLCHYFDRWWQS